VTEPVLGAVSGRGSGLAGKASKQLSQREEQVLRLIVRGLLNREVADRLSISVKTVETHKVNGMTKLGLASRVDMIDYAILHGWLDNN
jgi:DNA-binding NarL/FixJ family response regulator